MRRVRYLLMALTLGLAGCAGDGHGEADPADETDPALGELESRLESLEETNSALQTELDDARSETEQLASALSALEDSNAQLEAELAAALSAPSEADDPNATDDTSGPSDDGGDPPEEAEPVEVDRSALALDEIQPSLFVGGEVSLPDAPAGEVAVVVVGGRTDSALVVVVRNATDQPVYEVEVNGVARASDGSLIGSGTARDMYPALVPPGGIAFGSVFFGRDTLSDDSEIDLSVQSRDARRSYRDITLVELNFIPGDRPRFVGVMENTASNLGRFAQAAVACFDNDVPVAVETSFSDLVDIEAGQTDTFDLQLRRGIACDDHLVTAQILDN